MIPFHRNSLQLSTLILQKGPVAGYKVSLEIAQPVVAIALFLPFSGIFVKILIYYADLDTLKRLSEIFDDVIDIFDAD